MQRVPRLGGRDGAHCRAGAKAKEKNSVAGSSVAAAVLLTAGKLVVGVLSGSLGILSEALHSGLDLVAAVVTWVALLASG